MSSKENYMKENYTVSLTVPTSSSFELLENSYSSTNSYPRQKIIFNTNKSLIACEEYRQRLIKSGLAFSDFKVKTNY